MIRALLLSLIALPALAEPDPARRTVAAGLVVMGDDADPDLWHAVPAVALREAADGGPEVTFTIARYTGTAVTGDQGRAEIFSTLRAGLVLMPPDPAALAAAAAALSTRDPRRTVRVVPLRPTAVEAALLHGLDPIPAMSVHDEAPALWSERDVVLSFAPDQAELLEALLTGTGPALSLVWSLTGPAAPLPDAEITLTTTGTGPLDPAQLAEAVTAAAGNWPETAGYETLAAGAQAISLTPDQQALRVTRHDLDAGAPPDYPVLTAYNFAFADGGADGIVERLVEVEATGLTGLPTRAEVLFAADRPDASALPIQFTYAVDLTQPYRWRVVDLAETGELIEGPWTTPDYWRAVVDVTNAPARRTEP
ncbi:hypothetical protein [Roseobacter sp. HKCCA0434]|uniref:hypothetical protein n=1 Tax=Roseobacter sp. HKCCA0434 TaxID=3079297 RepID=UPI002905D51F|nr:hypothetical protein [Roseobacter sp. HKCCA0434]